MMLYFFPISVFSLFCPDNKMIKTSFKTASIINFLSFVFGFPCTAGYLCMRFTLSYFVGTRLQHHASRKQKPIMKQKPMTVYYNL